eukprot:15466726-Alexandrium_andersonii.AAC.1
MEQAGAGPITTMPAMAPAKMGGMLGGTRDLNIVTGNSSKSMELDHFVLWTHHVRTDPVSKRPVRAWKPFDGLQ